MASVGLVMIVKNEAKVIERCLASVRPLIDHVVIADTGSSDDTIERILKFMAREGLGGEVVNHPWRNFAHNRSESLAALHKWDIDYGFTIDADDRLVLDEGFDAAAFKASLTADVYDVELHDGQIRYTRAAMFSNRRLMRYRGVLHEFLETPPGATRATARGFHIWRQANSGGARSLNPHRYADDARLLEDELKVETDPFLVSRYTFYLAQSFRDSGQLEPSIDAYLKRAEQGHWIEEVYVSLVRAAQLSGRVGRTFDEQLALFLRAYDTFPSRAEALHGAAALCRAKARYHLGYILSLQGLSIPKPDRGLFLDQTVYDYGMLDEFQINAYWAGHYAESLDAGNRLLAEGKFPEKERDRIIKNRDFARSKLEGVPA